MIKDLNILQEAFSRARHREDEKDFHDELAGRDTFKIAGFLSAEARDERRDGRVSSQRRAENMSRLYLLLACNPAYAADYNKTFEALRHTENAADKAITRAVEALQQTQRQLRDTLSRAAVLPDGTRVFRDQSGQVRNEHGQILPEPEAAGIE